MDMNFIMHCVQSKAVAVVNEQAAGFVLGYGSQRIAGVLLPMNQVGGCGEAG